ncbi:hypothetical protein BDW69DRAFT_155507 [Aspergillus filifer]
MGYRHAMTPVPSPPPLTTITKYPTDSRPYPRPQSTSPEPELHSDVDILRRLIQATVRSR